MARTQTLLLSFAVLCALMLGAFCVAFPDNSAFADEEGYAALFGEYTPSMEVKRSANSVHFRNNDGSKTAILSITPINYLGKDGKYRLYDHTPNPCDLPGYSYCITESDMPTYFPTSSTGWMMVKDLTGNVVSWLEVGVYHIAPDGTKTLISSPNNAVPTALGATLTYNSIYTGVSSEYIVGTGNLKHNYILPARPDFLSAYSDGFIAFAFRLRPGLGQSMYVGENRVSSFITTSEQLLIRDSNGKELFAIPSPFACFRGITTRDEVEFVGYEIVPDGSDYIVYTRVPTGYLKDPSTKYPLNIDPSITLTDKNSDPTKYAEQGYSFNCWYRSSILAWTGVWVSPYVGPWIGSFELGHEPCHSAIIWKTTTINQYAMVTNVETKIYSLSDYGIGSSGHYVDLTDFKINVFGDPYKYDVFAGAFPPAIDQPVMHNEVGTGEVYFSRAFDNSAPASSYVPSATTWFDLGEQAVIDCDKQLSEAYFGFGLRTNQIQGLSGQRLGRLTEHNNPAAERQLCSITYVDAVSLTIDSNLTDVQIAIDGQYLDVIPSTLPVNFGYRTFSAPREIPISYNQERWFFESWSDGNTNPTATIFIDETFPYDTMYAQYAHQYYIEIFSAEGNIGGDNTGWYTENVAIDTYITGSAGQTIDTRRMAIGWTAEGSAPSTGSGSSIPPFPIKSYTRIIWTWEIQYRLTMQGALSGYLPGFSDTGWYARDMDMVGVGVNPWVQVSDGTRRYAAGWTGGGAVESGFGSVIPTWKMTKPSIVSWYYEIRYELGINSAHGSISGTTADYYVPGSLINTQVDAFVYDTANPAIRYNARTWSAIGSTVDGAGIRIPTFALNTPTYIVWNWTTQYQLHIFSLFGSVSPPDASWFDAGSQIQISASVPENSESERYAWVGWAGVGDGSISDGNETDTIVVNSPITQEAIWFAEFFLFLDPGLGTIVNMDTLSTWYAYGERVAVQAVSPIAALDTRYILGWVGDGAGAVNVAPRVGADTVVFIRILGPTRQKTNWVPQYKVRIRNTMTIGDPKPPVGDYWVNEGDLFYGSVMPNVGGMLCAGYESTGSIAPAELPIFSSIITEPSLVRWIWREGTDLPMKEWNDALLLAQGFRGRNIITQVSNDGSVIAVVFYSQELRQLRCHILSEGKWNAHIVAQGENIGAFVDMVLDENSNPHIGYFDGVRKEVVYAKFVQKDSKVGVGSFLKEVIETGDYGRSMTLRLGTNNLPRLVYYDELLTDVRYLERTPAGWVVHPIATNNDIGFYCTLALTPLVDVPQVAYIDSTTGHIRYAVYENNEWTVITLDTQPNITGPISMSIDIGGRPFVGYRTFTYPSRHTYYVANSDESGWHSTAVIDEVSDSIDAAFIIDKLGYIHFVYNNAEALAYLRYNGRQWERLNLDLGPNIKWATSVNVTSDEQLAVFYWKGSDLYALTTTALKIQQDDFVTPPPPARPIDQNDEISPSSGGCFIATAAFGSMIESSVTALCAVRDNTLNATYTGSSLVSLYYALSPDFANATSLPAVRAFSRHLLAE